MITWLLSHHVTHLCAVVCDSLQFLSVALSPKCFQLCYCPHTLVSGSLSDALFGVAGLLSKLHFYFVCHLHSVCLFLCGCVCVCVCLLCVLCLGLGGRWTCLAVPQGRSSRMRRRRSSTVCWLELLWSRPWSRRGLSEMENYCLCCTKSHQSTAHRCSLTWMIFGVKPVPSLGPCSHLFACVLRRLSSRLDNIKKTACGDGQSRCLLCGASFGPEGVTAVLCVQCKKVGVFLLLE